MLLGLQADFEWPPSWTSRPTPKVFPAPPPPEEPGKWNSRCGCGRRGYLGFNAFECENPLCPVSKPA